MVLYRARWACPETGKAMFRDFHSKGAAEAFKALPRDNLVFVEPYKPISFRQALRKTAVTPAVDRPI